MTQLPTSNFPSASLRLCVSLFLIGVVRADTLPLSDPNNTGGWVLNESVSDEFNGTSLDVGKWNNLGLDGDYHGEWKGIAPSQYDPANVSVNDGLLTITCRWNPEFAFFQGNSGSGYQYGKPAPVTTAALTSKAKFKFGYMEMRCRAADGPVSSSFWTTGSGGELDVFEHFGQKPADNYSARRFQASFHDWRKGSPTIGKRIWTNDHQLDFRVADDFHVYALEWDENYVKMYIDGRLVNCVTKQEMGDKWVVSNEQKVWIDSETFDWEVKPVALKAEDFGEGRKFIVDYCRIWQRTQPSAGCEPRSNLLANAGFESGLSSWTGTAVASTDVKSGNAAAALEASGVMEQTVSVKANTTYILSAWAKSPGTNQRNLWFNAVLGVRGHGNAETDTRFFFPYYHQKSLQFTTGPSATTAVIYFTNRPQGKQAIIDDIQLVEAPAAEERKRRE